MVWRLIRDHVSRSRDQYFYGFAAVFVTQFPAGMLASGWPWSNVLTLSCAAWVGPVLAMAQLAPREVQQLPISRREVWLARWVVATVGATLVCGAGQAFAMTVTLSFDAARLSLGAAFVFLYTSLLMATLPLQSLLSRLASRRVAKQVALALHVVGIVVVAGGVGWPLLLVGVLPATWADVDGTWTLGFAFGVAAVLVGLAHRPPVAAQDRPGASWRRPAAAVSREPARPSRDRIATPTPKRLVRLLWLDWLRVTAMAAAIVGVFVGFAVMLRAIVPAVADRADRMLQEGLPFGLDAPNPAMAVLFGYIVLTGRDWSLLPPKVDLLRHGVRHLRALPVNSVEIAAVLVLRRVSGWLTWWCLLLLAHVALAGPPDSLRIAWLAGVVGVDAIIHALQVRSRTPPATTIFAMLPLVVVAQLLGHADAPAGAVVMTAGLLGVVAAAFLHHHSVTRRELTYRPIEPQALL